MSDDNNKRAVAESVEQCQNQHDQAFADEVFRPWFVSHYRPEGLPLPETDRPASGSQAFYGALLPGFPDATMEINEQLAKRDLAATRKTFRGTHLGEIWDLSPTENRVQLEFIDRFRVTDGRLIEHWTSMDLGRFDIRRALAYSASSHPACSPMQHSSNSSRGTSAKRRARATRWR
jgi:predicted ester cyclase